MKKLSPWSQTPVVSDFQSSLIKNKEQECIHKKMLSAVFFGSNPLKHTQKKFQGTVLVIFALVTFLKKWLGFALLISLLRDSLFMLFSD